MSGENGSSSLADWIVRNEIEGKNLAIHAYDGILWKIRSGYLTLHFSSWALTVTVVEKDETREILVPFAVALVAISLGLAIAGIAIDCNYVQRKFRVIHSVDRLRVSAFRSVIAGESHGAPTVDPDDLRVAGDSGGEQYRGKGYEEAIGVSRRLYWIPLICTTLGVVFGLLLLTGS